MNTIKISISNHYFIKVLKLMEEELKFYALFKLEGGEEKKIPIKHIDFDTKKIICEKDGKIIEKDLNKVTSINIESDKPILILDDDNAIKKLD